MRWCPREVPGTVPAVRGHEGGIWLLRVCMEEDGERHSQSWNPRAMAGWEERHLQNMQDLKEEP